MSRRQCGSLMGGLVWDKTGWRKFFSLLLELLRFLTPNTCSIKQQKVFWNSSCSLIPSFAAEYVSAAAKSSCLWSPGACCKAEGGRLKDDFVFPVLSIFWLSPVHINVPLFSRRNVSFWISCFVPTTLEEPTCMVASFQSSLILKSSGKNKPLV